MITTHDPAELPEASTTDDPAEHFLEAWCPQCEHVVDAICPKCKTHVEPSGACTDGPSGSSLSRVEFYRRLLCLIQNARNSKFTIGCYLIATGDAFADGVSMTEYAKKWGVRKATVSKSCRQICAYLGIPPSQYMRKEETAAKFRTSNRRPRKL